MNTPSKIYTPTISETTGIPNPLVPESPPPGGKPHMKENSLFFRIVRKKKKIQPLNSLTGNNWCKLLAEVCIQYKEPQ